MKNIQIFRHGKALAQLGDYDKAMESLQKARKLSPNTEEIYTEIQKVLIIFSQFYMYFSGF